MNDLPRHGATGESRIPGEISGPRPTARGVWRIRLILIGLLGVIPGTAIVVRAAKVREQEAAITWIRHQRGFVDAGNKDAFPLWLAPLKFRTIREVSLPNSRVDAERLQALRAEAGLRRLDLAGSKLEPSVWPLLAHYGGLEILGLDRTNVTDQDVAWLCQLSNLWSLALEQTAVGPSGISRLGSLKRLQVLNLTDCGVKHPEPSMWQAFPSLHTVSLHEAQISGELVRQLRPLELRELSIRIPQGTGRGLREQLVSLGLTNVVGRRGRTGMPLWNATDPWPQTLAGVVEIVASRLQLPPDETERLLSALSAGELGPFWLRYPNLGNRQIRWQTEDDISSPAHVAELLDWLRQDPHSPGSRAFARSSLGREFVLQHLDALVAAASQEPNEDVRAKLVELLVFHGWTKPTAEAQIQRMLTASLLSTARAEVAIMIAEVLQANPGQQPPLLADQRAIAERALELLAPAFADPDWQVRVDVSRAWDQAVRLAPEKARTYFQTVCQISREGVDPQLQAPVIVALGSFGRVGGDEGAAAADYLLQLLIQSLPEMPPIGRRFGATSQETTVVGATVAALERMAEGEPTSARRALLGVLQVYETRPERQLVIRRLLARLTANVLSAS